MTTQYNEYLIEVKNLGVGYEGNIAFDTIYENDPYESNSYHAVRVIKDRVSIANILLKGSGGATGVYDNSFVLLNGTFITRCTNTVYAFSLPHLQLKWSKELDVATCFQLFDFEGDVLVHGECQITRITTEGDIKWEFSARDIFVNLNGHNEFEIIDKQIKLVDFENYEYLLDSNGKLISERLL
ncbi:MAG: hypothetical protein JKY70_22950 [Mucilaginibacter sp.]|nr:hypothetical protein [Mucilaginibacter sp.]